MQLFPNHYAYMLQFLILYFYFISSGACYISMLHNLVAMPILFQGLEAVITLAPNSIRDPPLTFDDYELSVALQNLLDDGAACVGVNCVRGPKTMIPLIKRLRQEVKVSLKITALC